MVDFTAKYMKLRKNEEIKTNFWLLSSQDWLGKFFFQIWYIDLTGISAANMVSVGVSYVLFKTTYLLSLQVVKDVFT